MKKITALDNAGNFGLTFGKELQDLSMKFPAGVEVFNSPEFEEMRNRYRTDERFKVSALLMVDDHLKGMFGIISSQGENKYVYRDTALLLRPILVNQNGVVPAATHEGSLMQHEVTFQYQIAQVDGSKHLWISLLNDQGLVITRFDKGVLQKDDLQESTDFFEIVYDDLQQMVDYYSKLKDVLTMKDIKTRWETAMEFAPTHVVKNKDAEVVGRFGSFKAGEVEKLVYWPDVAVNTSQTKAVVTAEDSDLLELNADNIELEFLKNSYVFEDEFDMQSVMR